MGQIVHSPSPPHPYGENKMSPHPRLIWGEVCYFSPIFTTSLPVYVSTPKSSTSILRSSQRLECSFSQIFSQKNKEKKNFLFYYYGVGDFSYKGKRRIFLF